MTDDADAMFQLGVNLPKNYAFTVRLKPATVKRTAVMLAPWALYMVAPKGRPRQVMLALASRFSPLAQPRVKPDE